MSKLDWGCQHSVLLKKLKFSWSCVYNQNRLHCMCLHTVQGIGLHFLVDLNVHTQKQTDIIKQGQQRKHKHYSYIRQHICQYGYIFLLVSIWKPIHQLGSDRFTF